MATSNAVMPWTLTMPAGSLGQWNFTFTTTNAATGQLAPYNITGATWEYVVRSTADTSNMLFSITTTTSSYGLITVTASSTLSQVQLSINPAATAALLPNTYYHALWMNPGTTSAFTWVTGNLIVVANPQP